MMICACCGRKKKLLDAFYSVGEGTSKIDLCSDCRDIARRLELDVLGGEKELYDIHRYQLQKRAKEPTDAFQMWQRELDEKIG